MKKLLLFVMFLISLNSLSEEFKYDNGDRLIVDIEEVTEGPYKIYWKNGDIEEGTYVNGKKEGTYKYYFKEDGNIEEGTYRNGLIEGPFIKYNTNLGAKEEGTYINGKKEGLATLYLKDGSKIEGIYKNDVLEGPFKFILPNGIKFEIPNINFQ